jgi:hypothetical protein
LGIFYHEKSDNTAVYLGNFLGKQWGTTSLIEIRSSLQ